MKRIYVVSLDDEVPLSKEVIDSIKVIGYLLYEEILGIEYDGSEKILCHDNISFNILLEKKENNTYVHRFTNNNVETGTYEPFMLNDTSFAFTVNDGKISPEEINNIINVVKTYVTSNCKFKINSITYEEDNKNKNRLLAIKKLLTDYSEKKEENKPKIKVRSILPMVGLILR